VTTSNKLCQITIRAVPLPDNVIRFLLREADSLKHFLQEKENLASVAREHLATAVSKEVKKKKKTKSNITREEFMEKLRKKLNKTPAGRDIIDDLLSG
jgi:DNA-binding response OmpR family regulator